MPEIARAAPLAGFDPIAGRAFRLSPVAPCARFILRGRGPAVTAAAGPLGFALPLASCRAAAAGAVAALWLGPDEWLLLAPEAEGAALQTRLAAALAGLPAAVVDVGYRQGGLLAEGASAAVALNAGCPLDFDPDAFPIGMCTRTVLGKAEIALWRTGAQTFRVEAQRSFLPYVWQFLEAAGREFIAA